MAHPSQPNKQLPAAAYKIISELIRDTGTLLEKHSDEAVDTNTELTFLALAIGSIIGIAVRADRHEETIRLMEGYIRAGIESTQDHCLEKILFN